MKTNQLVDRISCGLVDRSYDDGLFVGINLPHYSITLVYCGFT